VIVTVIFGSSISKTLAIVFFSYKESNILFTFLNILYSL